MKPSSHSRQNWTIRTFGFVGLVLLICLALIISRTMLAPQRASLTNFQRIQDGMTLGDVKSMLGEPKSRKTFGVLVGTVEESWYEQMEWEGEDILGTVIFDKRAYVVGKGHFRKQFRPKNNTLWQQLLRFVGFEVEGKYEYKFPNGKTGWGHHDF